MLSWLKTTRLHFIGIGGIGMSGIAEVLLDLGCIVSGSDLNSSSVTENLQMKGAKIFKGHAASNVEGANLVVYSSAIDINNPEYSHALKIGLPMIRRAEMLAELMRLKWGIAIAGSHGKTTTTSLVATIFHEANLDATHIIGGVVKNLGGNARKGDGHFLIAEADESDGSFLLLNPVMAAITNIDDDHLDFYKTKSRIVEAFVQFVNKLPFYGIAALNANDSTSLGIKTEIKRPVVWYGIDCASLEVDYLAKNLELNASGCEFDLYYKGQLVKSFSTNLLGRHNVSNVLAAIALCHQNKISWDKIQRGLLTFQGVGRRLENLYERAGLLVLDDYGHHPTEIKATISALKEVDSRHLCVVFEPHRFTRTKDFWQEFQTALVGAEEIFITPIYPANEKEIPGISSQELVLEMQRTCGKVHYLPDLKSMGELLRQRKNSNCIFLTMGAGSISKKIRELVAEL